MFQNYLNQVFAKYKTGVAKERSYYPVLENFLKQFSKDVGNFDVIVEPQTSTVDIPDFKVQNSKGLLVGYIEAKDVDVDLDRLDKRSEKQVDKYINQYPKVILTNFTDFRLFEDGKEIDKVRITQPVNFELNEPVLDNEGRLHSLLNRFFSTTIPEIRTAKKLSELLAHKTRVLRDLIREEIDLENEEATPTEELLHTFQKTLKPDMSPKDFADMYAQTITFGLFVARINSNGDKFTRYSAHTFIPNTIPLLKRVFKILSIEEVPQHIEWQVDEIAEILSHTKIKKIREHFFKEGKGRDPIIHFYETFLSEYDPKQREARGVYYTPQPVVSYITRSIHELLKEKFGKADGFADPSVTVLDPAAGTLTFPAEAIALAKEEFTKKHGSGNWKSLVKEHILEHFYAFELLMAPYSVGHLKMALLLDELGYEMEEEDRFNLYLTNTLDVEKFEPQPELLAKEISEESEKSYEIKRDIPILVVMGNPPYSVSSSNKKEFILDKLSGYKPTDEKKLNLDDDYIKFIRFAHWKIENAGKGVVGFITNNSFLNGITHRKMRSKLFHDFDEIYILNLHGSSRVDEAVPEGTVDQNVFDIMQGVTITFLIKTGEDTHENGKVFYADLFGKRGEKYDFLLKKSLFDVEWYQLKIAQFNSKFISTLWGKNRFKDELSFFEPKNSENILKYGNFLGITDIFREVGSGIKTERDPITIHFEKHQIKQVINDFYSLDDKELITKYETYDTRDWRLDRAIKDVEENYEKELYQKICYRPFDQRWTFYSGRTRGFIGTPGYKLAKQLLKPNLALSLSRQVVSDTWQHVFVADKPGEGCLNSSKTREWTYLVPMYLYLDSGELTLFETDALTSSIPNFTDKFLHLMRSIKEKPLSPEQIFHFIYAILNSPLYRARYQEFLKIDFPRVPFTSNIELFEQLSELGKQLADLHLMKDEVLDEPVSKFEGQDSGLVEKREYDEENKRVYINDSQYFTKVEPAVWNYYIGGYQVLDKWLKDRKGKHLSLDDSLHYRKIVTAISETIKLQAPIDELYSLVEQELIEFDHS